jgi:hypothetical protein
VVADEHEHVVVMLTSSDPYSARFLEKGASGFVIESTRLRLPRHIWDALGNPDELSLTVSAGDLFSDNEDDDRWSAASTYGLVVEEPWQET